MACAAAESSRASARPASPGSNHPRQRGMGLSSLALLLRGRHHEHRMSAPRTTLSATLPSSAAPIPPRPREAITIARAPALCSRIARAGFPSSTFTVDSGAPGPESRPIAYREKAESRCSRSAAVRPEPSDAAWTNVTGRPQIRASAPAAGTAASEFFEPSNGTMIE